MFNINLWDGQNEYQLSSTQPPAGGGSEWTSAGDGLWVRAVYGQGTVSVDIERGTQVSGDAFFIDLLNAIVIQVYLTLPIFGLGN